MLDHYPHELDGGMRQVVGIARALSLNPKLIVCDEPVSSLDVSVQAKIINLLMDIQKEMNLSYLFISHDLSVVRHISNRIAVMYLGQIVELCDTDTMFENTMHPYSIALLSAVPQVNVDAKVNRILLKGDVPSPMNPKPGCRFAPAAGWRRSGVLQRVRKAPAGGAQSLCGLPLCPAVPPADAAGGDQLSEIRRREKMAFRLLVYHDMPAFAVERLREHGIEIKRGRSPQRRGFAGILWIATAWWPLSSRSMVLTEPLWTRLRA